MLTFWKTSQWKTFVVCRSKGAAGILRGESAEYIEDWAPQIGLMSSKNSNKTSNTKIAPGNRKYLRC